MYYVDIPTDKDYPNVIFCRMNGSNKTNSWSNKWDQTDDLKNYVDGQTYTISSSGNGKMSGAWSNTTKYPTSKIEVTETALTGYYTCANLDALDGYTGNEEITYDAKAYFAVTVTNIPDSYDGKIVRVTPAYQQNGNRKITVFGETKEYMLDFTTSSEHITITLAHA